MRFIAAQARYHGVMRYARAMFCRVLLSLFHCHYAITPCFRRHFADMPISRLIAFFISTRHVDRDFDACFRCFATSPHTPFSAAASSHPPAPPPPIRLSRHAATITLRALRQLRSPILMPLIFARLLIRFDVGFRCCVFFMS